MSMSAFITFLKGRNKHSNVNFCRKYSFPYNARNSTKANDNNRNITNQMLSLFAQGPT
ncbi:Uncharacterized protein APZ42_011877 [Daphnia magna]|uniref:Uncharacterized protein n=1 Tax=Daphnia magna TaxID=35525 RepID=A0A162SFD7_9CRUS|nr:Uncharacterized protein APZ42_011877 [Daphnia magna]